MKSLAPAQAYTTTASLVAHMEQPLNLVRGVLATSAGVGIPWCLTFAWRQRRNPVPSHRVTHVTQAILVTALYLFPLPHRLDNRRFHRRRKQVHLGRSLPHRLDSRRLHLRRAAKGQDTQEDASSWDASKFLPFQRDRWCADESRRAPRRTASVGRPALVRCLSARRLPRSASSRQ